LLLAQAYAALSELLREITQSTTAVELGTGQVPSFNECKSLICDRFAQV
jgi:hypothetical protein